MRYAGGNSMPELAIRIFSENKSRML